MSFRGEQRGRPAPARRPRFPITPGRVGALGSLIVVAVAIGLIVIDSGPDGHAHPADAGSTATTASTRTTHTTSTTVQAGTASVPILVYHVINSQPTGSSANPALYVPTAEFSSQMQALHANGWHAVTLDQVEAYWTHGTSLGTGKPFVITFDNGYASQYANALPVLKGLGWPAVENLQVNGLSPSDGGLSEAQIHGLIAAHWELDTQGLDHTDLTTLDPAQVANDLTTARQMLHSTYGVPVNWFSYPSGDYDPTVTAAVKTAGYVGATTVNQGWANSQQDRFRLPTLPVAAGTTPSQLLAQIAAAKLDTSVPASYSAVGLA
ncbi:MAG: polysaccharide deacetylase family protein [Solirubrobacteraceae bacterium]